MNFSRLTTFGLWSLLSTACGGRSQSDRDGSSGATPHYTFASIVAGRDHYCGITQDERRLVCIEDGRIIFDEAGPFRSLDLNDDLGATWDYRCAVKETGELACWGLPDLAVPNAEFTDVSVGVFNACAKRISGELECWIPEALGGMGTSRFAGERYSVNMWSFCTQLDPLWSQCVDSADNQLLPADDSGHFYGGLYASVLAAPEAGCAAVLVAQQTDYTGTAFEPFAEVLNKNNVACFSADGARSKIEGTFSAFDIDVNEDGCALTSGEPSAVACWGRFADSVPADLAGSFTQISVSSGQACVLDTAGSVSCFRPLE